jgi:tRNA(fMet)-specific endonuclease VapC
VEEYLRGRLAIVARHSAAGGPSLVAAYARLEVGCNRLRDFPLVGFEANAEALFRQLRPTVVRVGTRDLRIACITRVNNLIVVTANTGDFAGIPGLVLEDWTV